MLQKLYRNIKHQEREVRFNRIKASFPELLKIVIYLHINFNNKNILNKI